MPRWRPPNLSPIVHQYPMRFLGYDFPSLVVNAEGIEASLDIDALSLAVATIDDHNASQLQDTVKISGRPHSVFIARDVKERRIVILIRPLEPSESTPETTVDRAVDEFGWVTVVSITGPTSAGARLEQAADALAALFQSAYIALEEAFITKYLEWRYGVLDRIYSLTNTHLRMLGRGTLVGRYWLSITLIRNLRFRYQFDRTTIENAIERFKRLRSRTVSAFQGLAVLIAEDAFDTVFGPPPAGTGKQVLEDGTVLLDFAVLPHYKTGQLPFWIAERELFGEKTMACIDLVTVDDISLQLNCPASEYRQYRDALEAAAGDIRTMFSKNRRAYTRDLQRMTKALERLRNSPAGAWLRELSVEITARTIKELSGM